MRRRAWLWTAPWVLGALFTALSLTSLPPAPFLVEHPDAVATRLLFGVVGPALYLGAAGLYLRIYRRRPRVVLLSVLTAFVLLAEASVAIVFGRNWHLSWWDLRTCEALGPRAVVQARPPVMVKGKRELVPAYVLQGLAEAT
jgi:hypothetical protein